MGIKKFISNIPCKFGYHKVNWFHMCIRCRRLLRIGRFTAAVDPWHPRRKPMTIEVYEEDVANGSLVGYTPYHDKSTKSR